MNVALVIPSCRGEQLRAFLEAWTPVRFWDHLVIVEDGPSRTFEVPTPHHYSHAEIDADLGPDAWVISRRDSAVRSYGFLMAYRLGCDFIVTLDDDCRPIPGIDHMAGHMAALCETPRWESTIPGLRVRGLPYGDRGALPDVMMNVGLWRGVPDLDAPTSLAVGCPTDFVPPAGSRILPRNTYAPLCGMNLAFVREFAPLAYFPLMGEGQPYRRFDDIWFGVIAKRICDHLGWSIAVGDPHVHHGRVSDPFVNLVKEAPGIAFNETFWRRIDALALTECSAAGCLREMGHGLEGSGDEYLRQLGRAMRIWAGFFDEGN